MKNTKNVNAAGAAPGSANEITLRACPFCGEAAVLRTEYSADEGVCVVCSNVECYCALGEGYDRDACPNHQFATEAAAAEAWNRRADDGNSPNVKVSDSGEGKL